MVLPLTRSAKPTRAEVTQALTKAAVGHFVKLRYGVYTELGLARGGTFRADVIALNYRKHIVICEIKSCYADWAADTKWLVSLDFCDRYYLVFSQAVWETHELQIRPSIKGRGAGVLVLDSTTGFLRSVVPASTLEFTEDRDDLILRMAFRGDFTKRNTTRRKVFL